MTAMARDAARAQRQAAANQRRLIREHERNLRQAERYRVLQEKEARQRYLEERLQEVNEQNAAVEEAINKLRRILEHTLTIDDAISFDSLRPQDKFPDFVVPRVLSQPYPESPREKFFFYVKKPNWFMSLFPSVKARHLSDLENAEKSYQSALSQYRTDEAERQRQIVSLRTQYEQDKLRFIRRQDEQNAEIDEFERAYGEGNREAIIAYASMVLERSEYPESFTHDFQVTYSPESKELVIEFDLPTPEVVPPVSEYKYIKARDAIDAKARKQAEIKELYQDVIAASALRTIHEVLEADQGNHVEVVTFNGFVQTVDPTTGRDVRPCLVSVRTTKERLAEIDLSRIDKKACLRNLGAHVSSRPDERVAVKPIVEFNMIDGRFVPGAMSSVNLSPGLILWNSHLGNLKI